MKNKKGFTLIELLAVIVILAVIMVIAVPKILDVIESSRRKAFENSANLIVEDAKLKYTNSTLNQSVVAGEYEFENGDYKDKNLQLNFKGEKPYSGKVIISNEGKVAMAIVSNNRKWCATKNYSDAEAKVKDYNEEDGCNVEDIPVASNLPLLPKDFARVDKKQVESIRFSNISTPEVENNVSKYTIDTVGGPITVFINLVLPNTFDRFNLVVAADGGMRMETSDMSFMFSDFTNLKEISFDNLDTSNVTDMSYMFCPENIGGSNTLNNLTNIDLKNLNTSKVTNMSYMFACLENLTSLDLSNLNTSNVINMTNMFRGSSSLTSLDLSNFNTSNVEDMSLMFTDCSSLTSLDLSNFDTSNVTTMEEMFQHSESLQTINLSGKFNTSNVKSMNTMFDDCLNLTNIIGLNNFDTSNVEDMGGMFHLCQSLAEIDLSSFKTKKVTNLGGMFDSCTLLTNLDLGSFDTPNLKNAEYMFNGCTNLETLDISKMDVSNLERDNMTYAKNMFNNTPNTMTIYVKDNSTGEFIKNYRNNYRDDNIKNSVTNIIEK